MPIYWAYCRISKKDQSKYSLQNQEILHRKFCPEGYTFELRKEEQSGRNFTGRKVLDRVLDECQSGDIVSFIDNSRFGRATKENIEVADTLRQKKVKFLVGNSEVTHDAVGKYRFQMESAASEFLSNLQAEKSLAGLYAAKDSGDWLYSSRLYGYQHLRRGVEVIPEEAAILKELFTRYAGGESLNSIRRDFTVRGIRNRKGTAIITSTISKMLDNPIYMGFCLPQGVKIPDKETLIPSNLYQPPIVEPELWWKCWDSRRTLVRKHGIQYEYRYGHYPLGGMIACPVCKKSFIHSFTKSRDKVYDMYILKDHSGCSNTTSGIASMVIEEVMRVIYIMHTVMAKEITEQMKASMKAQIDRRSDDITRLRKIKTEAEKKLASLLDKIDFVKGNAIAEKKLKDDLKKVEQEINLAETNIMVFESEKIDYKQELDNLIVRYKTDTAVQAMQKQHGELKKIFAEMFESITVENKLLIVKADTIEWHCMLPIGAKRLPKTLTIQGFKNGVLRTNSPVEFNWSQTGSGEQSDL